MDTDETLLLPQWITEEDILQEHRIRQFLEQPSSKRILRLKFARYQDLCFSNVPVGALPLFASESWEKKMELIIDWAETQNAEIQGLVLKFIADPSDENADYIISLLPSQIRRKREPVNRRSLKDLLLFEIGRKEFLYQEDLYSLARKFLVNSKRPEAAVRQALRVLVREGLITRQGSLVKLTRKEA